MKSKRPETQVGISITPTTLEGVVCSKKDFSIASHCALPMPEGVLSVGGDEVADPVALGRQINELLKTLKYSGRQGISLSVPGTLLRMVEMPKITPEQMATALSSEAERYKPFGNTEAVVDFEILEGDASASAGQPVVFGAIRKDTLESYLKAFSSVKVKVASLDIEPLSALRGMAATGVLDSLITQIGPDACWGILFIEADRVRFGLWQSNRLLELREVYMETAGLVNGEADALLVSEIAEEIQRTTKKTLDPVIWLTYGLSQSASNRLEEHFRRPFYPCRVGPALQGVQPDISLPAIGASLSTQAAFSFPFGFNLLDNHTLTVKKNGKSSGGASIQEVPNPSANWLLLGGVACLLLMGCLSAGFSIYGGMLNQRQSERDSEKTAESAKLQGMNGQLAILRQKSGIRAQLLAMAQEARIRNTVYEKLTEDLKIKTPAQLWVHTVKVGDRLEIDGKALDHEAVLHFARAFDGAPYAKAILIQSIQEGLIGTKPVFEFKINGDIQLNPTLLEAADTIGDKLPDLRSSGAKLLNGLAAGAAAPLPQKPRETSSVAPQPDHATERHSHHHRHRKHHRRG